MATFRNQVIDADAHVVETERVWDYLDASEQKYRPVLMTSAENPQRQIWVLDGENLGSKFPSPDEKQSAEHLKRFGREVGTPIEARELSDVKQRLQHMDDLSPEVKRKILSDNPRRFYGISCLVGMAAPDERLLVNRS